VKQEATNIPSTPETPSVSDDESTQEDSESVEEEILEEPATAL